MNRNNGMDEAKKKFQELQSFIPFLENFLTSIKPKIEQPKSSLTKKDDTVSKCAKTEQLLGLLKSGYKR